MRNIDDPIVLERDERTSLYAQLEALGVPEEPSRAATAGGQL